MRRPAYLMLCIGIATACTFAQQPAPLPNPVKLQPERVKVYSVGPGVTAPELLPLDLPPITQEKCKRKIDGKVELSMLVDTAGRARNIMFLRPLGTEADAFALHIADADRFTPGTADGKPAVVAESMQVKIQSCAVETKDSGGKNTYVLKLRSAPIQRLEAFPANPEDAVLTSGEFSSKEGNAAGTHTEHVAGSTKAPIPLTQPEAEYTDTARRAKINGTCLISLIVDPQGMPQDLQLKKSLDPGLDQNALYAVSRYRFKPAMRNGEPVPVIITIEVTFKIW